MWFSFGLWKFESNIRGAQIYHLQNSCRRLRQIDDAISGKGSAIGNLNFHRFPIGQIRNLYPATEGQAGMRGGQLRLIKNRSAGRLLSMMLRPIP